MPMSGCMPSPPPPVVLSPMLTPVVSGGPPLLLSTPLVLAGPPVEVSPTPLLPPVSVPSPVSLAGGIEVMGGVVPNGLSSGDSTVQAVPPAAMATAMATPMATLGPKLIDACMVRFPRPSIPGIAVGPEPPTDDVRRAARTIVPIRPVERARAPCGVCCRHRAISTAGVETRDREPRARGGFDRLEPVRLRVRHQGDRGAA